MLQSYLYFVQSFLLFHLLPEVLGVFQNSLSKYSYIVLIELNHKETYCTGALITPLWVLTAAHCVNGEVDDQINVYIGNTSQLTNVTEEIIQERTSSFYRVPYSYTLSQDSGVSDLAVIKLQKEFNHGPGLKLAPIMTSVSSISEMKCQVVGYNVSKYLANSDSISEMDLLEYDIMVQRECINNDEVVVGSNLKHRSWICQEDQTIFENLFAESGVLLFCKGTNSYLSLLGVAAGKYHSILGIPAEKHKHNPLIFTDICPYLSWLRSILGPILIPSPDGDHHDISSEYGFRVSVMRADERMVTEADLQICRPQVWQSLPPFPTQNLISSAPLTIMNKCVQFYQ